MLSERTEWDTVTELIQTQHYEQLDEILQNALINTSDDSLLYHIVSAAQQLCLACRICQDETNWYQWLAEESNRHEQELAQALNLIAAIANERSLVSIQSEIFVMPNSEKKRLHPVSDNSLWQQIQNLLFPIRDKTPHTNGKVIPKEIPAVVPKTTEDYEFSIYLLGTFRVYHQGQLIENWPTRKSKSLFKYLIMHHHQQIPKEVLMDVFWPDAEPEAARNNLNVTIYSLRQTLRHSNLASHILFKDGNYSFNPHLNIWIDVEAFDEHLKQAKAYEKAQAISKAVQEYMMAEALYLGEFLEEDRYEDWVASRRMNLENTYLKILEFLSSYYIQQGNFAAILPLCSKMLKVDMCNEKAHRLLMNCYHQQGQRHLALRQYHLCEEALKKELDTLPSPETKQLYEHIRSL